MSGDQLATVLTRLTGVRSTGHDKGVAICPAHDDHKPSLSYKVADSGAILLYCWAGCTVQEITAAAGINLTDLFPPKELSTDPRGKWKPWRQRIQNSLAPLVIRFQHDLLITYVLLTDIAAGKPISEADRITAKAAADRVWAAIEDGKHAI